MTMSPGIAGTSAQRRTPSPTRQQGSWRSASGGVLMQCDRCGQKVLGEVKSGRLTFMDVGNEVVPADLVARREWDKAEARRDIPAANRLRRAYMDIREQPERFIHRPGTCGGGWTAYRPDGGYRVVQDG